MSNKDVIIFIPARLAATRLPNKPLADIAGKPMIVHVAESGVAADIGEVVVAAGDSEIYEAVRDHGYQAVLTPAELSSGTDRVFYAYQQMKAQHQFVINLQGDLPGIDPKIIKQLYTKMRNADEDITTAVTPISINDNADNPNIVKAILTQNQRALYFTRSLCPHGEGEFYHHVGIYGYKAHALKTFIQLPPSPLEIRENLEQLRALENGLTIGSIIIDHLPISVDIPQDLQKAREVISARG